MLESAYILPLVPRLDWANAVSPPNTLNSVNFSLPLDVGQYGLRDLQLAYRDLVVGAALAQVAMKCTDVWDFSAPKPILPYPASSVLANNAVDYPATTPVAYPGRVDQVDNQSLPINASNTDSQLYARDVLIYQALQQAATALVENPIPITLAPGLVYSDLWALAYGLNQSASIGYNLPLSPALFSAPDKYLAWRDNTLAAYVAATVNNLGNIYAVAARLLVQVSGVSAAEPEVYVLVSDDGRHRTWAAQPLVLGKLQLVYDRVAQTLSWADVAMASVGGPAPVATSFISAFNNTVTVVNDLQGYLDADFYRQKSARLNVRPWKDQTLFSTAQPENYWLQDLTQPVIYQPDSVLISTAGTASFAVPQKVPASCTRVGLILEPSQEIDVLGYTAVGALSSSVNGTSLICAPAVASQWSFTLPSGRLFFSFTCHDGTGQALSFNVTCAYNGTTVFGGSILYNQLTGTQVTSQLVEIDSNGNPCVFTVTWDGANSAASSFVLDKLSFFTQAQAGQQVEYTVQVALGGVTSNMLTLAGVPGRVDCAWFDFCMPAGSTLPTLAVTWWPGGPSDQSSVPAGDQICLYIYAFDVRQFSAVETLPTPRAYDPYKQALVQRALGSVQQSFSSVQTAQPTDYRTLDAVTGDYLWTSESNTQWLNAISQVETRLFSAFTLGGPGDVGRLALIPAGLQLDEGTRVLATNAFALPVLRTFQPWMSDFGALVAGPDFIPLSDNGCQSQGLAPFHADFQAVPTVFGTPLVVPAIVDLQATSYFPGAPNGKEYIAYTIANTGPSGGTVSQTVAWTATFTNLIVGHTYTFVIVTMQTNLSTLAAAEVDIPVTFTATSTTQQISG